MIKQTLYSEDEIQLINPYPLSVSALSTIADEIRDEMCNYRPEFKNLVSLQRNAGCRVQELFQPDRWKIVSRNTVQVKPQKGNALRVLSIPDIGFDDSDVFSLVLADMYRLPSRQYERAISSIIKQRNLYRLYEEGFSHPSTHFFRHVKIKELHQQGYEKPFIATWIGEKNVDNLDYYIDSKYFM